MEWSKLKNIIIILLVLVNLFLLLLAGGRQQQRTAAQAEMRRGTLSILESRGISVAEEQVPWDKESVARVTTHDPEKERAMVEALLGKIASSSAGIATEYRAAGGLARFYPDGRFTILPKEDGKRSYEDLARHAEAYLRKMGFSLKLVKDEQQQSGERSLRYLQMAQGDLVFSCEIEMQYRDGKLLRAQGWRLLGELQDDESRVSLPASTLLLHFAQAQEEGQLGCTRIERITPGYLYATASLSSTSELLPVWLIETDQGSIFLNCLSGEIEEPGLWLHGELFQDLA